MSHRHFIEASVIVNPGPQARVENRLFNTAEIAQVFADTNTGGTVLLLRDGSALRCIPPLLVVRPAPDWRRGCHGAAHPGRSLSTSSHLMMAVPVPVQINRQACSRGDQRPTL